MTLVAIFVGCGPRNTIPSHVGRFVERGDKALAHGDAQRAGRFYDEALDRIQGPEPIPLLHKRAQAFLAAGEYREGLHFVEHRKRFDDSPRLALYRVVFVAGSGDMEMARDLLRTDSFQDLGPLEVAANDHWLLRDLGDIYFKWKPNFAIAAYSAVGLEPSRALKFVISLLEVGSQNALRRADRVLRDLVDSEIADQVVQLSCAVGVGLQTADTIERCSRAVAVAPTPANIFNLGLAYAYLAREADARAVLSRLTELGAEELARRLLRAINNLE